MSTISEKDNDYQHFSLVKEDTDPNEVTRILNQDLEKENTILREMCEKLKQKMMSLLESMDNRPIVEKPPGYTKE